MFITSDLKAIQFSLRMREQGLSVPRDCSLIGFDDLPIAAFTTPALTTLRQDLLMKARYTVDTLLHHIDDPSRPSERIILDVSLIERGSVADLRT